jgi:hypothetical protein
MTPDAPDLPAHRIAVYTDARWRIERTSDDRLDLVIRSTADGPDGHPREMRFLMSAEQGYTLVHETDRVLAWAAPTAQGVFTRPDGSGTMSPEVVRSFLSIHGYIVIAPDIDTHTRMVQATPWANWVEELPAASAQVIAWFVNVFAADDAQFGQIALAHGVQCEPSAYVGQPEAADD